MEVLYERCCGIDVHKRIVVACLKCGKKQELCEFGTTTEELRSLTEGLANRKSSHELHKGEGRGYVFNNDGNQTSYCYDIDRIMTIDYDRNKVRDMVKELTHAADEVSIKIDEALLQTQVDYTPKFDLAGENDFILEELMGK